MGPVSRAQTHCIWQRPHFRELRQASWLTADLRHVCPGLPDSQGLRFDLWAHFPASTTWGCLCFCDTLHWFRHISLFTRPRTGSDCQSENSSLWSVRKTQCLEVCRGGAGALRTVLGSITKVRSVKSPCLPVTGQDAFFLLSCFSFELYQLHVVIRHFRPVDIT